MPKIQYQHKNFRAASLALIDTANDIIDEYSKMDFVLTLRQLYYQMVARAIIENSQRSYKRLGNLINNARLGGLVDWRAIVDRTRELRGVSTWENPKGVMQSVLRSYKEDLWLTQPHRVEVWIEKDALTGIIEGVCNEQRINYFSCRGYSSASETWKAGQRLARYIQAGQDPLILHLGDHDPSGMDMTRDIIERLDLFSQSFIEVDRIALNMDQIEQYGPPPNPTKLTDSRAESYVVKHGYDSWELDALDPMVMAELIRGKVEAVIDQNEWNMALEQEEYHHSLLVEATAKMENKSR